MSHLHTPERLLGESFDKYRERRAASHLANKRAASGTLLRWMDSGKDRRSAVKAAGGIRQYKRQQYRARGWL